MYVPQYQNQQQQQQQRLLILLVLVISTSLFVLWVPNAVTVTVVAAAGAVITTNKQQYARNEPIVVTWNYTSVYTTTGERNDDIIVIFYNRTIPTFENQGNEGQMLVYVSTLSDFANATIRNVGTITFDGMDTSQGNAQYWPLAGGLYTCYIYDSANGNAYASSIPFTISPFIRSRDGIYEYNTPITLSWDYFSTYTNLGGNINNTDQIIIYNSNNTIGNPGFNAKLTIRMVYISTLLEQSINSTIRNSGMIVFNDNNSTTNNNSTMNTTTTNNNNNTSIPPGSYYAIIIDRNTSNNIYVTSDIFSILPNTTTTTNKWCNVFFLKRFFCPEYNCGLIRRLLKLCN